MEYLFKVITSDGEEFSVTREVLKYSITIDNMLVVLDNVDDEPIELHNIDSEIFKIILDWISRYISDPPETVPDENDYSTVFQTTWEDEFFQDISQVTLHKLIMASTYLDVKYLSIAAFKLVARIINSAKTAAELRESFGIQNDFSDDEAREVDNEQNDDSQRLLQQIEEASNCEHGEESELQEHQDDYDHENAEFYDEDDATPDDMEWDTEDEETEDEDDVDDSDSDDNDSDTSSDSDEDIEEENERRDDANVEAPDGENL